MQHYSTYSRFSAIFTIFTHKFTCDDTDTCRGGFRLGGPAEHIHGNIPKACKQIERNSQGTQIPRCASV